MSLQPKLRAVDRTRCTQAMTAWTCNDKDALEAVLDEVNKDPSGVSGLLFALMSYCDWLHGITGTSDQPPDDLGQR
jgi:hypothetical protein